MPKLNKYERKERYGEKLKAKYPCIKEFEWDCDSMEPGLNICWLKPTHYSTDSEGGFIHFTHKMELIKLLETTVHPLTVEVVENDRWGCLPANYGFDTKQELINCIINLQKENPVEV